ncbi:uncharacterized protein H6S33_001155 [Morchella sextelata]|uniref:uncharacterized protein n=1 Tax=Morchella sextelata TaxID=1174677 RepID=UPI001D042CA5|nr:uncharacterized protein H6S33_001155 [Morchella sextelata]KAH0608927.1 hypothetical protein H6S33_001155 [Morchella sextelata]
MASSLARPSPFDSSAAPTPKRRKFSQPSKSFDSDDDSGDDLFSNDVATLPLNSSFYNKIPESDPILGSSPPPLSTQATQLLQPTLDGSPSIPQPPVVQVAASSPFRNIVSSPPRVAQVRQSPLKSSSIIQADGSVKPFDFYPNGRKTDLMDEGPQYIGVSSDDGSDHDIKPTFLKGSLSSKPVPSVSSMRDRRDNAADIVRIEETPPVQSAFKSAMSKFAFNGSAPQAPFKRLDSITKKPPITYSSGGGSIAGARPKLQRHPDRAKPLMDISIEEIQNIEHRKVVQRMASILPDRSISTLLSALIEKQGNFDNAIEYLTGDDGMVDLTLSSDEKPQRGMAQIKTSNRAARVPRMGIKDKWSSTQAQPILSSPPAPPAKTKRRLVRGSGRNSRDKSSSPPAPTFTISDDDSDSAAEAAEDSDGERELERKVLKYINECTVKELSDIAATTEEIAEVVLSQKPFRSLDEVREVSSDTTAKPKAKGKGAPRGARTRAIGDKVVDVCLETWRGYEAVDSLIARVEELGKPIAESIKKWGVDVFGGNSDNPAGELDMTDIKIDSRAESLKDSAIGTPTDAGSSDIVMIDDGDEVIRNKREHQAGQFFKNQPKHLGEGVVLKDYQLVGVNWLSLLYERKLSCILADEMGLGKTCQVISFLAHLLEKGIQGPHLVVVPSSTLENWLREFQNFCPLLRVEPYYGSQKERAEMRMDLTRDRGWNVLVTTYQLATGDKLDKKFLKDQAFNVCVYDEGHLLKNSSSNRYDALMRLPANFRLLLTGTPLQNNLQELASLLAFILPEVFNEKREDLASIFKYKAKTTDEDESNSALLSAQRIKRARAMMTPFVLRRKKAQVLKHLPAKTNRVEYCPLNPTQNSIYVEHITAAKEAIEARAAGKKGSKSTSNLMMQLRKAAIHPLLFRKIYTEEKIKKMSHEILKEEVYRSSEQQYILEDMETIGKHALQEQEWMQSGKVEQLKAMLIEFKKKGDRVLLFSQFTQMLDILELVLTSLDLGFLRIDGSTPVDARQDLIDQYHEEDDIMVFLLSTKAGGFGINLACANKVVIFDSSFNPHDDAQAADRAHRVGQKREVEVIRLVTKNTIEEQILALANTKLALDRGISEDALEGKAEELVAKMLLQSTSENTKDLEFSDK